MPDVTQAVIVVLAGIAVAVADALLKKACVDVSFLGALRNPLMIVVVALYLAQVVFFTYVFVNNWQLGVVGILQMAAYSAFVLATGVFVFKESYTATQYLGFVLAVAGAILINL